MRAQATGLKVLRHKAWDRGYLVPSYWDRRDPLCQGPGAFSRLLSFYLDINDNGIRRTLASIPGFKADIPCGKGRLLDHASVGVDFSQGMLARAKTVGRELVRADVKHLPFRDKAFGLVYSANIMPHLTEKGQVQFQEEVERVARKIWLIDWQPRSVYFSLFERFSWVKPKHLRSILALSLAVVADRLASASFRAPARKPR